MKTIVFGSGMVGSAFTGVKRFTKDEVDVTCFHKVQAAISKEAPDIIINCASMTDIYKCERNPSEAYRVNVGGMINIASACKTIKPKIIQFSTIFSGDSNIYTKTKKVAEDILPQVYDNYAIIQLPWLFSRDNDCKFTNTVVRCLKGGKHIPVYAEEIGSPTYTLDVARYVLKNGHKLKGKLVIANSGSATREEWAREIATILKLKNIKFNIIQRTVDMMTDSRVENINLSKVIFRHWREALAECLGKGNLIHN